MITDRKRIVERLQQARSIDPATGCWLWLGAHYSGTAQSPYGVIQISKRRLSVHRVAAHLWLGMDLNDERCVCHRCDVPLCFNPAHLFIGTQFDNVRDAWWKGRGRHQVFKGSTNPMAKLTEEQVIEIRRLRDKEGLMYHEIAKRIGCSARAVGKICRGERWTHVLYSSEVH